MDSGLPLRAPSSVALSRFVASSLLPFFPLPFVATSLRRYVASSSWLTGEDLGAPHLADQGFGNLFRRRKTVASATARADGLLVVGKFRFDEGLDLRRVVDDSLAYLGIDEPGLP